MPIPCPAPSSNHEPIPEGADEVETLRNVIEHLAEKDRPFLEQRCKDLLGLLRGVPSPTKGA